MVAVAVAAVAAIAAVAAVAAVVVVVFIALSQQFGSFQTRKLLMNRIVVRALELMLCRLRAIL